MERRFVVVVMVVVLVAGCTEQLRRDGVTDQSSVQYDSQVFDHGGLDEPVIAGGLQYDPEQSGAQRYATVIGSAAEADRFNGEVLDAEAAAFITNTNFSTASLVVFQSFPESSQPDYRVESVERDGTVVNIQMNDSSVGGTGDVTVETVLLRIDGTVTSATVTTEDGKTVETGKSGE